MAPILAFLPKSAARPLGLGAGGRGPGRPGLEHHDERDARGDVRTGQDVLDAFTAALPVGRNLILVPHSNAGAYVPALTTLRSVVGVVFVDAVLPPTHGRVPLAPSPRRPASTCTWWSNRFRSRPTSPTSSVGSASGCQRSEPSRGCRDRSCRHPAVTLLPRGTAAVSHHQFRFGAYYGMMKPEDAVLTFVTFLIAMAVYAWLFRITFDRPIGGSISFATAPAMITAGLMGWSLGRRHANP